MMREVTPPFDDLEDEHVGRGSQPTSSSPSRATFEAGGINPSSGPVRSNELRAARRLAEKLNLFPYQRDALNELVRVYSELL
jgi:hypothetical protein